MLDLIDIIQPGSIGYDMVAAGISHEVNCLIAVLPVTVDHSFWIENDIIMQHF